MKWIMKSNNRKIVTPQSLDAYIKGIGNITDKLAR